MLEEIRFWTWFMVLSPLFCCADPAVKSYHARGLVKEVAGSGAELTVAIHHEKLPHFSGRDGVASEMESMTMLFGVASAVPASALNPGDKVMFDFDVRWNQRPSLVITHVESLPNSTELALSTN